MLLNYDRLIRIENFADDKLLISLVVYSLIFYLSEWAKNKI